MRRAWCLLWCWALALSACALPRGDVLATRDAGPTPAPLIRTCEEAFAGRLGARCEFTEICMRPLDACRQIAICDGALRFLEECPPCTRDVECGPASLCEGESCVPCAPVDPGACAPCPFGWTRPPRNGCVTCDQACLPPSECEIASGDDVCAAGMGFCVEGEACGRGCAPGDPGCCANQCAPAPWPCDPRTPLGCMAACPAELPCETGICLATACVCNEMIGPRWACRVECLEAEFAMTFALHECVFDGPELP